MLFLDICSIYFYFNSIIDDILYEFFFIFIELVIFNKFKIYFLKYKYLYIWKKFCLNKIEGYYIVVFFCLVCIFV